MTPEEAVIARLDDIGALTALVGERIYQVNLPQDVTMPAVRISRVGMGIEQHLRGLNGLRSTRVQLDSFATAESGGDPLAEANAVADAAMGDGNGTSASGLLGWIGEIASSPTSIQIVNVEHVTSGQDYDPEERRTVRVFHDVRVWWKPV